MNVQCELDVLHNELRSVDIDQIHGIQNDLCPILGHGMNINIEHPFL